ncbi:MAG: hypothetical protein M1821_008484 [Bathelium mastoideum]|nr:MAG: hypothetical protein M1821_008484 [Bathelium mastoideum]
MSLARAFTTRRAKRPEVTEPQNTSNVSRAYSTRAPGKGLKANQISGPVALLSTTNMLSYNAPDIQGTPRIRHISTSSISNTRVASTSSDSSQRSSPDSDTGNSSPESMTDASSVTDSGPPSPMNNHLSTYFQAPKAVSRSQSTSSLRSKASHSKSLSIDSVPSVPSRAPSHSKRAHQDMARKRSLHHHGSVPNFRQSKESPRPVTAEVFARGSVEPNHPFGKELDQLMEVAEEFNGAVRNIELDEDYTYMQTRGLARFDANDYTLEISGLYSMRFEDQIAIVEQAWI